MSPAVEVVNTIRSRPRRRPAHSARWYARGRAGLNPAASDLLHALIPDDHPYSPDFLTPYPQSTQDTLDTVVEAIATTPPEIVEYQLDIGLDGRQVRPELAAVFPSEAAYRAWRRPPPPALQSLMSAGPTAVAETAAQAIRTFFETALSEDWPLLRSVLEADITFRGEQISRLGMAAMLANLGDALEWTGDELRLTRSFDVVVDWASDGVVFVPSAAHVGPILFCAERPYSPMIIYPVRGVAALWTESTAPAQADALTNLIGDTRVKILTHLNEPRSTRALSHMDGRSEATVSYHLGVLSRAGLVIKRRTGRSVKYRRTPLADALLNVDGVTPIARR